MKKAKSVKKGGIVKLSVEDLIAKGNEALHSMEPELACVYLTRALDEDSLNIAALDSMTDAVCIKESH